MSGWEMYCTAPSFIPEDKEIYIRQLHKMVKHTQTIRQTMALKGLNNIKIQNLH